MSPRDWYSRGLVPTTVQITQVFPFADSDYVTDHVWERVVLGTCPFHPEGGCGVERHGTYNRVHPPGTRIARFWCPMRRATVSVLPAFLASRLSATLDEVEAVVDAVDSSTSLEAAADKLRPDNVEDAVTLPSAVRWVLRRVKPIRAALLALVTLMVAEFEGCAPKLAAIRSHLGVTRVLVALRTIAVRHLGAIGPPLGLHPRGRP